MEAREMEARIQRAYRRKLAGAAGARAGRSALIERAGRRGIFTCTDRDGVVYRRWRTDEASAREYAERFVPEPWTMLVGPDGRILVERALQ